MRRISSGLVPALLPSWSQQPWSLQPWLAAFALLPLLGVLLLGASARAQDRAIPFDPPRLAQSPEPLCYCWSEGRKIAEGAIACIRTTQGRRLAACGRVINMMSWEVTENPCPES
ncbi:hypothetical protein [Bosea sp. 685]|uniref:hypothetical protein n=1 Tax=Bosea sp. 685 TaxID=3080057 RepID=UPI002893392F|nr:hypothetical protein [Bosea sp. 685]WNJ89709.1 hypothetical protein RMR04_25455 [Bosea sp. 685]